jgi:hypothetical protein
MVFPLRSGKTKKLYRPTPLMAGKGTGKRHSESDGTGDPALCDAIALYSGET